ncbi:hypothetical protein [Tenacibaculum discolor]|uniref:Transposase n=2 Tax=Tenacibaculum TaxID=104267 RepID=A0ABT9F6N3_9FLAO|nr:hypothetical protein [Tenacibaculum discolor]MDP2542081.1 hypothetical protein [Tenacibaculum discolor]
MSKIIEKNRNIEIAKQLKRKGVDNETIVFATGLTIEEVKKLRVKRV